MLLDELGSKYLGRLAALFGHRLKKGLHAVRAGRSGQYAVDGDCRAGGELGQTTRHRQLRGLGDAVMNHLLRNVQTGFRRNEHDPPPVAPEHAGQVGARQPHPGHHVGLEKPGPVRVLDLKKILRLEDAGVVHQDVDIGHGAHERCAARGRSHVGRNALNARARQFGPQRLDRRLHGRLAPAIDEYPRAGCRQAARNRPSDPGAGAGHQGGLSCQFDFHRSALRSASDSRRRSGFKHIRWNRPHR